MDRSGGRAVRRRGAVTRPGTRRRARVASVRRVVPGVRHGARAHHRSVADRRQRASVGTGVPRRLDGIPDRFG